MNIFDELLSQVEDNTVEDTFESELLSAFSNGVDTELYTEADKELTPEQVAEMKAKAKKIKKAIKIALVVLATILGIRAIAKSNAGERLALQAKITKLEKEKAALKKDSDADKSKITELETKIKELRESEKELKKTEGAYKKTKEYKDKEAEEKAKAKAKELTDKLKDANSSIDKLLKQGQDAKECTKAWADSLNKIFKQAELLIAQVDTLKKGNSSLSSLKNFNADTEFVKLSDKRDRVFGGSADTSKLDNTDLKKAYERRNKKQSGSKPTGASDYSFTGYNDTVRYVKGANGQPGKYQKKATSGKNKGSFVDMNSVTEPSWVDVDVFFVNEFAVCVESDKYSEYANFMETSTDKFLSGDISFDQYCVLSSKAIEKYGDIMINEATSVPDEYDLIMDAICEKFNNNKISIDQAVLLMEKAGDKYLDESYEEDDFEEDDFDDQLLMTAEESADYNAEYERLVDAICEKYNNNEINADDTILLLEKAVDKYSIDYSSDDLYDDTYEESSDDDDDSDYTSIFDDDDTD